ncbi:MAG TPA: TonB-dependent receptor plug domain-containing protein, partial [Flavitalea sp.]|nr:TonB-dependent receptor plug domain-containing protein [Flavitalea sp.]
MKQLRSLLVIMFLLLAAIPAAFAQNKTISGKITDANGQPIVGATVTARGSNVATQTNSDGIYSLTVPANVQRVTVSSVGFASQELSIAGKNEINLSLVASASELSEVIVTALGVERNKKSLPFSTTTLAGDNFTQAREISTANALAGRVAGVNVTKIASGPGGSSRVVIRGAKTLGSTLNQPLYVIDGVPIDNTNFGQAGVWGGADQGDGMNSINPDDIASMTILKGASAAALYGSRAANGVILIATKKGSGRRGVSVEFNSNYVLETVQDLTDFQKSYGNGGYVGTSLQTQTAQVPKTIDEHWNNGWGYNGWGPKMDGRPTVQFDGITRPY